MSEATRHQLGQWFTPEPVADLALLLALQGTPPHARLLDPSCGDGVFLRRAARLGIAEGQLIGVDLDARAIAAARVQVPGAILRHCDFFESVDLGSERVDVVVGNPPYVRQERLEAGAKEKMVRRLSTDWPGLDRRALEKLIGRGDLAAPFLLRALRRLSEGGRAALVISSAFLDSGYGAQFWHLLNQVAHLSLVVDAPQERWFRDAAVNAVIAVFGAGPSDREVCFARLRVSSERAAQEIAGGGSIGEVADLRFASSSEPQTWAASLRAPDAWFRFVETAGDALTTLGQVAEVRRGITSGANDIFYLSRERAKLLELPEQFLRPLLRAPGKSGRAQILADWRDSKDVALVIDAHTDLSSHASLERYLRSFPDAADRRTLRARTPWWALRVRPGRSFLSKAYAERFVQPYCTRPIIADQRVYCLHPVEGLDPSLLSALLNATPTALALESLGRASMGQGALEWTVLDAAELPILDPRQIADDSDIRSLFHRLASRPIGKLADEAQRDDRRMLDEALLARWPAICALREELQHALLDTCLARQQRAKAP